ncbi:hypothetical protein QJS10_CPB17g02175 [Acorus calamus]|uniref:DUF3741 domain-containing protein n=1 Tax=Acorus calamus TaxID=4465 RepID=A0AAV9CX44_ACOCL|nr:hypothetical protein QJS10_CPB17g02175 [Acorus calamus]
MARRSDFAQKLLDDLRLRKEQMRNGFDRASGDYSRYDGYGNSQTPYRGTGDANAWKVVSGNKPNIGSKQRPLNPGDNKAPVLEAASNEIIMIGGARSSRNAKDLSLELTIALGNKGKLQHMALTDMRGKQIILHQGSMGFGETDRQHRSTGQQPLISHIHIGEISRGAQNLNKILKALSNGLNFDRDSIDIGRELLKGAMDLEDSLRMLANLEEASNYMVSPQGKKIGLLKGKEEEEEDSIETTRPKLWNRRRFSFDGSSRHSLEDVKDISKDKQFEQKTLVLHNPSRPKTPQPNLNKHSQNNSHHRRSASCGPSAEAYIATSIAGSRDSRSEKLRSCSDSAVAIVPVSSYRASNIAIEQNSSTSHPHIQTPKHDKARLPNVIAKLMGLEELPPLRTESNSSRVGKGHSSHKNMAGEDIVQFDTEGNTKKSEAKMSTENSQRKMVHKSNTTEAAQATNHKTVSGEQNSKLQEARNKERMMLEPSSKKINQKISTSTHQSRRSSTSKKAAAKGAYHKPKEPKNREKDDLLFRDHQKAATEIDSQSKASQLHRQAEGADSESYVLGKKGTLQQNNQKYVKDGLEPICIDKSQQQLMIQTLEFESAAHEAREQESVMKNRLQATEESKSDIMQKNLQQPLHELNLHKVMITKKEVGSDKKHSTGRIEVTQSRESINKKRSTYTMPNVESLNNSSQMQESSKSASTSDIEGVEPCPVPVITTEPSLVQSARKDAIATEVHINKSTRKVNRKIVTPCEIEKELKPPTSVLQELKQRRHERIRKSQVTTKSSPQMDPGKYVQHNIDQTSTSSTPSTDDVTEPKEANKITTIHSNNEGTTTCDSGAPQNLEVSVNNDQLSESFHNKENQHKGPTDNENVHQRFSDEQHPVIMDFKKGSLTENEKQLKHILINSQHFLNTADALFKLKIPVEIPQGSKKKCLDGEGKLLLDCGYEIMRRMGKREELNFHPSMKAASEIIIVECLDDLIKALNENIQSLKSNSKYEGDDNSTSKCLHELLKKDILGMDPDVNSLWDSGWKKSALAHQEQDEIIKDVEKHILNGLIDEITKDLSNIHMTVFL